MKNLVEYMNEDTGCMTCQAYGGSDDANKLRDTLGIKGSTVGETCTEDGYILTDNGAYDLQKSGKNGVYVWCGFQHKNGAADRSMRNGLHNFTKKVAAAMKEVYGGKPVIEDFVKTTDMFRIYIKQ